MQRTPTNTVTPRTKKTAGQAPAAGRANAQPVYVRRRPRKRQPNQKVKAVASAYKSLTPVALAIALPSEHPGIRLPTLDMPRTSVATLRDTLAVTTPNAASYNGFEAGTFLMAHYGQPGRLGLYTKVQTADSVYTAKFCNTGSSWSSTWRAFNNGISGGAGTYSLSQDWPYVGATWTSGPTFHGGLLPYGKAESGSYMFLNAGDRLTVSSASIGTVTGSIQYSVWEYDAPGVAPVHSYTGAVALSGSSVTITFNAAATGYYKIRLDSIVITAGSVTAGSGFGATLSVLTAATLKWAHVTMGDIDNTDRKSVV